MILSSPLLSLRQRTKPYHDRLESRLDILSRIDSMSGYRTILTRFYGFYVPLEPILAYHIQTAAPEFTYERRRKAGHLMADLHTLGLSSAEIAALPLCVELTTLLSLPQALGCLYVLEGATLGGQIIARHLKTSLGLDETNGAAFFNSYGDDTGRMWRAYGENLTAYVALHGNQDSNKTTLEWAIEQPLDPSLEETIIAAACDTFARFEIWLCTGDKPK
jgi:heme oxygenase (biliverdin-IX-beta and delta-forming)